MGRFGGPPRAALGGRKQIDAALDRMCEDRFAERWERHRNGRYWRVWFGGDVGVTTYSTPWYSQAEISAWIDGVRTMGAAI